MVVLHFAHHEPITAGELMDWITQSTTSRRRNDSGKDGVVAVAQTLNRCNFA